MEYFDWNDDKNRWLISERGVSFEDIVVEIVTGNLLDKVSHPNINKYPSQNVFYVKYSDYVYAVPFIEDEEKIFLKTIIPDRKATKKYLGY